MSDAAMRVLPEMGIKEAKEGRLLDFRERAEAMCETAMTLTALGMDLPEPDELDEDIADRIATAYAEDPYGTSEEITDDRASTLTPASLMLAHDVLERFGHQVVKDSTRIRHFVTNKLLMEAENKDPRIRMKALELLGKISDVGLFTEKRHITHESVSNNEIHSRLRDKLKVLEGEFVEIASDE